MMAMPSGLPPQPAHDSSGSAGSGWMLIFADMLSLLLAFFVLLFSMSTLRIDTWLSMTNGLKQRLNPARYQAETSGPSDKDLPRSTDRKAMNLGYLAPLIEEKIGAVRDLRMASITPQSDRIIISIPSDALFFGRDQTLNSDGVRRIFVLGGLLSTIGNRVTVAAHMDPSRGAKSQNPMVMSIERATAVARAFAASGYGEVDSALGYADPAGQGVVSEPTTRYRDRVDIIIHDALDATVTRKQGS